MFRQQPYPTINNLAIPMFRNDAKYEYENFRKLYRH